MEICIDNSKSDSLEDYLDKISNSSNKKIPNKFMHTWKYFNYPNSNIFVNDLDLLLQTVYTDVKIIQDSHVRLLQHEFRKGLIEQYSGKCVVSYNDSLEELEASHIVEVKDGGDSDISNGLLLEANLHKTFDKYLWTINPDTLIIESNPNNVTNSVKKYIGNKVNIELNPFLYTNLKKRYDIFAEKNN
jgi:hypothetical protein